MSSSTPPTPGRRARLLMVVAVAVTALLYVMPYGHYVIYPLKIFATLVHELGHGVTAMALGGELDGLTIYPDGSGVARSRYDGSALTRALVAAGGLVGPATLGALFFVASVRPWLARGTLWGFGVGLGALSIWGISGVFGWVFVSLVGALCLGIAWRGSAAGCQAAVVFLGTQLALSVYSTGDYLFVESARVAGAGSPMPSDVAQIANALVGPYWLWGALCGGFSVVVLGLGLRIFWVATAPSTSHEPNPDSLGAIDEPSGAQGPPLGSHSTSTPYRRG